MFNNPNYFYMIPLVLLLLGALYIRSRRKRRIRVNEISQIYEHSKNDQSNNSILRSRIKVTATVIGFTLLLVALARPQVGFQWTDIHKIERNILVLLDVSQSMLVEDVYPNRLERSKFVVDEILDRMPGTNVGLLIFAGDAFLQCPITGDHSALRKSLKSQSPDTLQYQGSNISKALLQLPELLKNPSLDRVILISDGENHSRTLNSTIEFLINREIVIHSICIGTQKGGLIPNSNPESNEPYFYDHFGNVVYSKAHPAVLKSISTRLNGQFFHFDSEHYSIRKLDSLFTTGNAKNDIETKKQKIPVEYYQLPLLLAFILLCFEFSVGTRRSDS